MNNMQWFYLDDERPVPFGCRQDMILIPTYMDMINTINMCQAYNISFAIDFDYDLDEMNGMYVANYIVEHNVPMMCFHIHSSNEEGSAQIREYLTSYGYREEPPIFD